MDPQTRARIEFEARQYAARQDARPKPSLSDLGDELRPHVFAHAAFALLDQAIAENVDCLRANGVAVGYKRLDVALCVSLGLRRATFALKLSDQAVGIAFFTSSPYAGGAERADFVRSWPAETMPIEHLHEPIQVFMEDMRAFLMNGTVPAV